jgi:hypothetical protein
VEDNSQPNQFIAFQVTHKSTKQKIRWGLWTWFISLEITAVYIAVYELFDFNWIQLNSYTFKKIQSKYYYEIYVWICVQICEFNRIQENSREQ